MTSEIDVGMREHEGLAVWAAKRLGSGILRMDERIQAARIGLWKALLRHDPSRGPISTLAQKAMENEILNAIKQESTYKARVSPEAESAEQIHDLMTPEVVLAAKETCQDLAKHASKMVRRRSRNGAKWTASDVVAMRRKGLSCAAIGRKLKVTRERIRQVLAQVRRECERSKT